VYRFTSSNIQEGKAEEENKKSRQIRNFKILIYHLLSVYFSYTLIKLLFFVYILLDKDNDYINEYPCWKEFMIMWACFCANQIVSFRLIWFLARESGTKTPLDLKWKLKWV